jgi:hypothetical protein
MQPAEEGSTRQCGEESSVLRIRRSIEHLLLNESQQMVA